MVEWNYTDLLKIGQKFKKRFVFIYNIGRSNHGNGKQKNTIKRIQCFNC